MDRTSLKGLSYEQKKDRFEFFIMVYKSSNVSKSDAARAAKLKPGTASIWYDRWIAGEIFHEVERPNQDGKK